MACRDGRTICTTPAARQSCYGLPSRHAMLIRSYRCGGGLVCQGMKFGEAIGRILLVHIEPEGQDLKINAYVTQDGFGFRIFGSRLQ